MIHLFDEEIFEKVLFAVQSLSLHPPYPRESLFIIITPLERLKFWKLANKKGLEVESSLGFLLRDTEIFPLPYSLIRRRKGKKFPAQYALGFAEVQRGEILILRTYYPISKHEKFCYMRISHTDAERCRSFYSEKKEISKEFSSI